MHPVLLRTPLFTIYTFGVLLAAAYLSALGWLVRGARRHGLNPDLFFSLGMWAIIGALIGAKALYLVRSADVSWQSAISSAGDFYGGFIGGLVASGIFFWRHPAISVWQAADICAPAIALGQAIGRIGCFMAGDDYGRPTSVSWGVVFTNPDAAQIGGAPLGVRLHPVQLYESVVCLALFAALVWLTRRRRRDGDVIIAYTFLYAAARFVLEFYRGDADRGFVFGGLLSTSQFIGMIMFAIAMIALPMRSKRQARVSESGGRNAGT